MLSRGRGGEKEQKKIPDMRVVMEAWELELYTLSITSSGRRFPKKYRFSLCNVMQNTALEIAGLLIEANEITLMDVLRRGKRFDLQSAAMRKCKMLLHYIELTKRLQIINDNSFEHWARIANNVKNMCAKWQESDIKRIKQFDEQKGGAL
jgi:hypothetical protein